LAPGNLGFPGDLGTPVFVFIILFRYLLIH
jgi:hypothetical protein